MNKTRQLIATLVAVALVTLALALLGPTLFQKKTDHVPPAGAPAVADHATVAKGVIESEHEAVLSSQAIGMITEVKAAEGDSVKRGQVLAVIGAEKIRAQIQRAEALLALKKERLKELEAGTRKEDLAISGSVERARGAVYEQARQEYERQQRLYAKDATTKVEVDRAEERMKTSLAQLDETREFELKQKNGHRTEELGQARAEVNGAAADLAYYRAQGSDYRIRAPHDGLILDKFKETGESVEVGTPVLKLVDPSTPRVRAELEESDVGKVREGQEVELITDSYPNKVYRGKVYLVLPAVKKKALKTFDPLASYDMNSQDIYIHLDDYSQLKMGMTATVRFKK